MCFHEMKLGKLRCFVPSITRSKTVKVLLYAPITSTPPPSSPHELSGSHWAFIDCKIGLCAVSSLIEKLLTEYHIVFLRLLLIIALLSLIGIERTPLPSPKIQHHKGGRHNIVESGGAIALDFPHFAPAVRVTTPVTEQMALTFSIVM